MTPLAKSRTAGLVVGALIGVLLAIIPLADWWDFRAVDFVVIPGGVAAAMGALVAGLVVGPRVAARPDQPGATAFRFAVFMVIAALPLVAIDAAIMSTRPLNEPWPFVPGPILGALIGTAVRAPLLLAVSFVAAPVWTALVKAAVSAMGGRPPADTSQTT